MAGLAGLFARGLAAQEMPADSWLFLAAGLGVTTRHGGSRDRLSGLAQRTAAGP